MTTARRMWGALKLLDRQIVDRDGRMAGNVDDVVLDLVEGQLVVTGIRSGPGALVKRLGSRRLADWLQATHSALDDLDGVIPLGKVSSIGNHVTVAEDADDLASTRTEFWFRDHVISHIPGNRHAAE